MKAVSISYVDGRTSICGWGCARLTNAFSKKLENHCHALALYFMFYFVLIHKTLKVAPAMAAQVSDRLGVWTTLLR